MKTTINNFFTKIAACTLVLANLTSCSSDFLNEKLITSESTDSFKTINGVEKLSVGLYQNLEFHFAYVWAIATTNYGTDEMSVGNDATESAWNNYNSALNSAEGYAVAQVWDNMYSGISTANTLIKNVPLVYAPGTTEYKTRLGEGLFMRGFNYFRLVQQYGGVPLLTAPIEGSSTDFKRNSAEEIYAQVISDLTEAFNILPDKAAQTGRITKWAAAHFLAKAHLFRASELNADWNAPYVQADLDNVIKYGQEVIVAHPLCKDYVELWDFKTPNGANEKVSEVVLAAQFSNDANTYGRYGNQLHLYYPSIYQNLAGLRRDISGDREFSRLRTTDYAIDVFDRKNDSRFWKSFITTYTCNNPAGAPKWGEYAPAGFTQNDPKFKGGEIAIKYIVNDANDNRYTDVNIMRMAPHMFVRYFAGETTQKYIEPHGNFGAYSRERGRYIALSKFRDGSRSSVATQFGQRDGILARSAEDYLMVAEAYGRQKKYDQALPFINKLRERAGYASGEDRAKHVDGGQSYKTNANIGIQGDGGSGLKNGLAVYCETNTYYESNNILTPTTESTKNSLLLNSTADIFNSTKEFYQELGAQTESDKFLAFILNERTRELCGELIRWPDLARTKQLEKRFKKFNDGSLQEGADFKASKHYLRPIPQAYLDAITNNGKALTSEEKTAMQNPGW